eukprot:jgi/Botrbrau1/12461/Bobra.0169s0009.1
MRSAVSPESADNHIPRRTISRVIENKLQMTGLSQANGSMTLGLPPMSKPRAVWSEESSAYLGHMS